MALTQNPKVSKLQFLKLMTKNSLTSIERKLTTIKNMPRELSMIT